MKKLGVAPLPGVSVCAGAATAPEGGRAFTPAAAGTMNFAIVEARTPERILREGSGFVTGLAYGYNGEEIVATCINGS